MLDSKFRFDLDESFERRNPYDLVLKKCHNWNHSSRRILIVLQTVDSRDIKIGQMLGDRSTEQAVKNCIKYSRKLASRYLKDGLPEAAYAVVNFNAFRHLNLSPMAKKEAEQVFADRVLEIIKTLKPTHVLVSGDEAIASMFPEIKHPQYKRGWVHKLKVGSLSLKVASTLDFTRLIEKGGELANLLGFWCRHFAYLQIGRNPHDLSQMKISSRYVDTIEKFDRLMERVGSATEVAVDTETRNLSVLHNKIYTIQFCTNHNEEAGYVLSVDHPLAHWTRAQRIYIKRGLKALFSKREGPLLITFNGMFDLRILRQQLRIPIIWWKVWEVMFGEHELDENYTQLASATSIRDDQANDASKFGGLRPVFCSYGNDFYFRPSSFTKEDRATTGSVDPSTKDFLQYAAMDVCSLMGIKRCQIARAAHEEIAGKSYKPYFIRHMIHQMSDTAHTISHMNNDGSHVDRKYLRHLLSAESPLRAELRRSQGELKVYKEVKEANKRLVKDSGFKAGSLFGNKGTGKWIFNLNKAVHKQTLFINVLGLEPLKYTKTKSPQLDKEFINHYKDTNKIVGLFGEYQALSKLMSTYVKGTYKKIASNMDAMTDACIRASYFLVDTSRLGSQKPNLQQIPSRGKLAKIIKRMFIAQKGYLLLHFDYSAHEIRVWSIISGDKVLAEAFRIGQKLRQQFIQDPSDANRKAIKEKGDLHIQNVLRFFGKLVDKDHPLRDAVKAVVFGLLYGKAAETLGTDTKKGDLDALKAKISALYEESLTTKDNKRLAEINKKLEGLDLALTKIIEEDRTKYAQGIINKVFDEFKAGARWTRKTQKMAEEEFYVHAPNGRIRHLFAGLTGDFRIIAKQVRRGSNAPVQGLAAEICNKAARLILEGYFRNLKTFKEKLKLKATNWALRVLFNRSVHDATYFSVPYEMVLPFIHTMLYEGTYGVTKAYKDEFNIDFTIEPEIEIEVGARDDQSYKWSYAIPELIQNIKLAVKDADELGVLEGTQKQVLRQIFKPWKDKATRDYLQDIYPLLNIRDLDQQIEEAVAEV